MTARLEIARKYLYPSGGGEEITEARPRVSVLGEREDGRRTLTTERERKKMYARVKTDERNGASE